MAERTLKAMNGNGCPHCVFCGSPLHKEAAMREPAKQSTTSYRLAGTIAAESIFDAPSKFVAKDPDQKPISYSNTHQRETETANPVEHSLKRDAGGSTQPSDKVLDRRAEECDAAIQAIEPNLCSTLAPENSVLEKSKVNPIDCEPLKSILKDINALADDFKHLSAVARESITQLGALKDAVAGGKTLTTPNDALPSSGEQCQISAGNSSSIVEPGTIDRESNTRVFESSSTQRRAPQFPETPPSRSTPKEKRRGAADPSKATKRSLLATDRTPVQDNPTAPKPIIFHDSKLFELWNEVFPQKTMPKRSGKLLFKELVRLITNSPLDFVHQSTDGNHFKYFREAQDGYQAGSITVARPHPRQIHEGKDLHNLASSFRKEFGWEAETFRFVKVECPS